MNLSNFVIVSQSLILREGIFAFLRENSYSPNCITKVSSIEQFNRSSLNGNVIILDDYNLSQQEVTKILSHNMSPSPKLKTVILSLCLDIDYIDGIVAHPNTGFVYQIDVEQHLFSVVDMLKHNMMSMSPTALKRYREVRQMLDLGGITEDHKQVLRAFANGQSVDEMVDTFSIPKRTIYRYLDTWREVLNVSKSHLIVDHARQIGIL